MPNVEKISVAVTVEMAGAMREAVDSGEYASASEVVREALRDWRFRRARREQALHEVGGLWDEGVASGPASDGEQAFARIRRKLDEKIASGAG